VNQQYTTTIWYNYLDDTNAVQMQLLLIYLVQFKKSMIKAIGYEDGIAIAKSSCKIKV
jgi:hypothetical protein